MEPETQIERPETTWPPLSPEELTELFNTNPYEKFGVPVLQIHCVNSTKYYMKLQKDMMKRALMGATEDCADFRWFLGLHAKLLEGSLEALSSIRPLYKRVKRQRKIIAGARLPIFIISGVVISAVSLLDTISSRISSFLDLKFLCTQSAIGFLSQEAFLLLTPPPMIRFLGLFTVCASAILYYVQIEASLRVFLDVEKRLERLIYKLERKEEIVTVEDLKSLQGWRWNILFGDLFGDFFYWLF